MREPFPSPHRRLRAPRRRLRLSNRQDGSPRRRSERRVPAAKLQPFFQIFSIPFPFSVFSACFLLSFLRERPLSGKCRKNVVLRQFCFRFSRLSPSQRLFSAISSLRVRRTQRLFRNFATRVRLCLRHVGSWMPPAFSMPQMCPARSLEEARHVIFPYAHVIQRRQYAERFLPHRRL